jgi:hypothetical protein
MPKHAVRKMSDRERVVAKLAAEERHCGLRKSSRTDPIHFNGSKAK